MREFLNVPPGNQLGHLPEGGASGPASVTAASGGGSGGSGAGAAGATPAAKPGESASATPTPARAARPGESAPAPPAPARAAKPVESAATSPAAAGAAKPAESAPASAAPPVTDGGSAASLRAMALAAAAPTRIVNPAGGVFDVVVESAGAEDFPESSGALSGKPIYTAYVRAGGAKDWLLQYCIPAEGDHVVEVSGSVVRLTTGAALVAPYPRVTMRPPVKPRPGHHVMVHGYVTVEGRFRDLTLLSAANAGEAEMVEAVLEQWQFRAASRDGKPIEVEILLAIPAE